MDLVSGNGGIAVGTQFLTSTGTEGKWLTISIGGEFVAPGFFLVTVLKTESLSAKGCKEGSINLQKGVLAGLDVWSSSVSLGIQP